MALTRLRDEPRGARLVVCPAGGRTCRLHAPPVPGLQLAHVDDPSRPTG